MKIYDCFPFYNEYDLLEIRLQELWDHVDHFVISEANTTHAGNPKPFNLEENWERFKPYADKIIYIKVEDMPGVINNDYWHNEKWQRECLTRGLMEVYDDDIIILSDIDEIVRPSAVDFVRSDKQHDVWGFRMPCFNFKFNYMWIYGQPYQVYPQAFTVDRFRRSFQSLNQIRFQYGGLWPGRPIDYDDGKDICLQHGGWHFSSLGDSEHVKNKYRNFGHNEKQGIIDSIDVDRYIAEGRTSIDDHHIFEPVALDGYFPKTIVNNPEKYHQYIISDVTETVNDKYKKMHQYFTDTDYYNNIPKYDY